MTRPCGCRHASFFLLVALLWACGGGGGGGSGPTAPPPPPQASLVFSPAGGGANSLSLVASAESTSSRLVLSLSATDVEALYGVAFDLDYPDQVLRYDGASEGDFLTQAGEFVTTVQTAQPTSGRLVIGVTRLGPVPGASGSGTLLTLEFTAIGSGQGNLAFSNNRAFDPQGEVRPDVAWFGGSVEVVL